MDINIWKFRRQLTRLTGKIVSGTIVFSSGVLTNYITEVDSIADFAHVLVSINKPAILIMWILFAITIIIIALSIIVDYFCKKQNPSVEFNNIMISHTDAELNRIGLNELSWGFNKNIHRCKDPGGWLPEAFYISSYEDNVEYIFPNKNDELPGYTREAFLRFQSSKEIQACIKRGNNKERFSVWQIIPNYNNRSRKVEIRIIKTKWVPLLFSWDYFRRLDKTNQLIANTHQEEIINKTAKAFLDNSHDNSFALNSFCLHLILETKDGKAILAKISRNKNNDYPSTWAATIGEQLEKEDFFDTTSNSIRPNFVERWVKRALLEEFDISDEPKYGSESEYDEIVYEKSLRVLSIDMEGDIYNIAMTCVLKLRLTLNEFKESKALWADSEETTDLKACNLEEIREILLNYPNNCQEYHPSTYLRLLMFHLYKTGTGALCKLISRDYRLIN